ncbi:helix-turn-helix domain-containing protein [Cryptosporangium phraense]|uniref:Helix-turn-helix domain-containing protein n=1 Tax=Cryptosporangium phraense TaxID=2593070 RepID=A0A545AF86_9ACTN|nr:helix-turn-helix domain-containing protein [Cryptosporangium phraense]TQS39997.1 helix-turn-helix domain-containing protein [Cryptosporangium phraense]
MRCRWEQRVGDTPHVQRVLPDNCADILVTADGRALLVGPPTHVELPRLPAGTLIRGLRFHPYAVRTALHTDVAELTDQSVDLDDVLGAATARTVAEQIWAGSDVELAHTWGNAEPDRATAGIVRMLTAPGAPSVDAVADRAGYSSRHLRRVVHAETGLSPKTLQRVARLHDFLRAAEAGISSAAAAAGYADQPHASREIRALTGLAPGQLLRERGLT